MKRLLAAGFPDIAQVCRVFRDGEAGRRHQPEFTMIEWYRRDFDLDAMMSETERLLSSLLGERCSMPRRCASATGMPFVHMPVSTLLKQTSRRSPSARMRIATYARRLGSDRDAWLDLTMLNNVAPAFDKRRLTSVFTIRPARRRLPALNPVRRWHCGPL